MFSEIVVMRQQKVRVNIVTWQLKGRNNGVRRNCPLLDNSLINMYQGNGYACNSRETVGNSVFYVETKRLHGNTDPPPLCRREDPISKHIHV
jgi:hypothetical protein